MDAIKPPPREPLPDSEWINLPFGGSHAGFYVGRLIDELQQRPGREMLVGAVSASLDRVDSESLDYFLRTRYAKRPDTKQAVREVLRELVATGKIEHIEKQPGIPAGFIRMI